MHVCEGEMALVVDLAVRAERRATGDLGFRFEGFADFGIFQLGGSKAERGRRGGVRWWWW